MEESWLWSYIPYSIPGDNPKAHKTSYENYCSFHEKWQFLWKLLWFLWKLLQFSWKECAFHKKHLKSEKHTEKQQKQLIQHRSLILTWCFIEYRGKANYVYLMFWWCLVVMCILWCMHVYMVHIYVPLIVHACGACMCMYVHVVICTHLLVHVCAYGECMCIWCIYEKHLKSEKEMKSTPEKWKTHKKNTWKVKSTPQKRKTY